MVREALADRRVCSCSTTRPTPSRSTPLLPDNPDCLVVAVAAGPADRHPRRTARARSAAWTPSPRSSCWAASPARCASPSTPRPPSRSSRQCGGQPAALMLAGGWLAARPKASVADVAKQLRGLPDDAEQPAGARPLARAFRLVYASLPQPAARMLRLLALAPGRPGRPAHRLRAGRLLGRGGPHRRWTTSSRSACCTAFRSTPQYEVPGCLAPLLRALLPRPGAAGRGAAGPGADAGADRTAAAVLPGRHRARGLRGPQEARGDCRAPCVSRPRRPPRTGCAAGGPRCWPSARLAVGRRRAGHAGPPADRPRWSGPWSPTAAPRPPLPSSTACTSWSSTWPSAASLHREQAAALLNLGRPGRPDRPYRGRAGALPGRSGRRTRPRTTRTRPAARWNP